MFRSDNYESDKKREKIQDFSQRNVPCSPNVVLQNETISKIPIENMNATEGHIQKMRCMHTQMISNIVDIARYINPECRKNNDTINYVSCKIYKRMVNPRLSW